MKFSWGKGLLVAAVTIVSAPAYAGVVVHIDKSSQRMACLLGFRQEDDSRRCVLHRALLIRAVATRPNS